MIIAFLSCVVGVGAAISTAVGFGSTLVILALGSLVMPVNAVLFRIMPVTVLLSASILLRSPRAVDLRVLFGRILPAMALGLPAGLFLLDALAPAQLERGFAAFVFLLASVELVAMARTNASRVRPLSRAASLALLFLGGVAHGALATGGPPVVYVCARTLPDKTTFRATLSALWLVLSVVLLAAYTLRGHVTAITLRDSLRLLPGLAVGVVVGDVLHRRVSQRVFRVLVFIGLVIVSVVMAVRA